jgi:hypothetical protein
MDFHGKPHFTRLDASNDRDALDFALRPTPTPPFVSQQALSKNLVLDDLASSAGSFPFLNGKYRETNRRFALLAKRPEHPPPAPHLPTPHFELSQGPLNRGGFFFLDKEVGNLRVRRFLLTAFPPF